MNALVLVWSFLRDKVFATAVAQLGLRLQSERFVRRVAAITCRHFALKWGGAVGETLNAAADEFDPPKDKFLK